MLDARLQSSTAQLVAVFVECTFYGIYLVTFVASLQTVLRSSPQRPWLSCLKSNRLMLTVVLLMFIVSTLNLALGLVRVIQGFIYGARFGNSAVEQLGLDWVNILKPLTVNIQIMIADFVMTYRCWVLYAKSYRVVIFPIFMWLAGLACAGTSMYIQGVLTSGANSRVNGGTLYPVVAASWSATIALNIYATTMIVLRIWPIINKAAVAYRLSSFPAISQPQTRLHIVMRIMLESGLVYTIMTVIVFVTHISGSNSIFITSAVEMQIIGITFNLILVRAKNASDASVVEDNTEHGIAFAPPTNPHTRDTGNDTVVYSQRSDLGSGDVEMAIEGLEKGRDICTRHTF